MRLIYLEPVDLLSADWSY